MDRLVAFGDEVYWIMFLCLITGRFADLFSTWLATPNLALEANPIAKRLGWKWGIPVNFALCVAFACWPLPGIILTTTSLLVAARNFQSGWLMRSMGESRYRGWMSHRLRETSPFLHTGCVAAQTLIHAAIGAPLVWTGYRFQSLIPFGIGLGMVTFAFAVAFFTLLATFRIRRGSLSCMNPN